MIYHALFPTLVCEFHHPNKDDFKKIFFENIFKHFNPEGYSHEGTGNLDIHLEPAFEELFLFVSNNAKQYLDFLGVDSDLFDIHIIRAWLNVLGEKHTPTHSHADAHLSFVYYVQIPPGLEKPLIFLNESPNELFHGMNDGNIKTLNVFNSGQQAFTPIEGQMLVFPAKLRHLTGGYGSGEMDSGCKTVEALKQRRVCIAGDFILTYKNKMARYFGLQPVSKWKVFN